MNLSVFKKTQFLRNEYDIFRIYREINLAELVVTVYKPPSGPEKA